MASPAKDSLVLYKAGAALVQSGGDKLEILTREGKTVKVRPKDVTLLHNGPITGFGSLKPCEGEIEEAWELLAGSETELEELAELIYESFTPATAWATWELVAQGHYFRGQPDCIEVLDAETVESLRIARESKEREHQEWSAFISRVRANRFEENDHERLASVVAMARGKGKSSKVLKELGKTPSPENAHTLLLRLGYWGPEDNPHPYRFDVPERCPDLDYPGLPEEDRLDLTHLTSYAIDDEGNTDPDDAISLDGDRIWVHVADVGALVKPSDPIDLEARGRGANSYLPERTTTMLPPPLTDILGLGLQETSPALSFGMKLAEDGELHGEVEIAISRVRVTRLTYQQAEGMLDEGPLAEMSALIDRFAVRRKRIGSASLDLPEVKIKVKEDGEIRIKPLARLRSREMVTNAMLMAGEAAARFAQTHELPIPYATQDPPDSAREPEDMAAMFAYRKQFKRTRMATEPGLHAGLGLPIYTRATSPLRRYLDLVVHQQLRAHLQGEAPLDADQVLERVGAAEAVSGQVRGAERAANKHWTLVFLKRNPSWEGLSVLVDKRRGKGIVIIPELGLETSITMDGDPPLNSILTLGKARVDLPNLSATFKLLGTQEPTV